MSDNNSIDENVKGAIMESTTPEEIQNTIMQLGDSINEWVKSEDGQQAMQGLSDLFVAVRELKDVVTQEIDALTEDSDGMGGAGSDSHDLF